jgi:hypothetical protein
MNILYVSYSLLVTTFLEVAKFHNNIIYKDGTTVQMVGKKYQLSLKRQQKDVLIR